MSLDPYFYHYLFIAIFVLVSIIFALLPLLLASKLAPRKPSEIKNKTYECGLDAPGDAWIQYRVQYYIYALMFVVFDIETIFIYPWAVAFKQLGLFAFVEMIIFIAILGFGLYYAWQKRLLEWE